MAVKQTGSLTGAERASDTFHHIGGQLFVMVTGIENTTDDYDLQMMVDGMWIFINGDGGSQLDMVRPARSFQGFPQGDYRLYRDRDTSITEIHKFWYDNPPRTRQEARIG